MNRYLIIAGLSLALAAPISNASVWTDVKDAGRDVGHGFKNGWHKVAGTSKDTPEEKCDKDAKVSKASDSKTNGCKTVADKKK